MHLARTILSAVALLTSAACFSPVEQAWPYDYEVDAGRATGDAGVKQDFVPRNDAEEASWSAWNQAGSQQCSTAADCVRVDLTCCPCSSGGLEVAATPSGAAQVRAALQDCPEVQGCLLSDNCHRQEPSCVKGLCSFVIP